MKVHDKELLLAILASFTQIIILLINTKYTLLASNNSERNGKKLNKLNKDVHDSISTPYLSQKEREALKEEHEAEQRRGTEF